MSLVLGAAAFFLAAGNDRAQPIPAGHATDFTSQHVFRTAE